MRTELVCDARGRSVGRGWYEEQGLRLHFGVRLPDEGALCKLWLVQGEKRMLLGTPAPRDGALVLERTLSKTELTRWGVYPPQRVEVDWTREPSGAKAVPGQETWLPVTGGEPTLGDPVLSELFRRGGWSWRRWEKGVVLGRTWEENTPFPGVTLFCFARVERGSARRRVCYYLGAGGKPVFPP